MGDCYSLKPEECKEKEECQLVDYGDDMEPMCDRISCYSFDEEKACMAFEAEECEWTEGYFGDGSGMTMGCQEKMTEPSGSGGSGKGDDDDCYSLKGKECTDKEECQLVDYGDDMEPMCERISCYSFDEEKACMAFEAEECEWTEGYFGDSNGTTMGCQEEMKGPSGSGGNGGGGGDDDDCYGLKGK